MKLLEIAQARFDHSRREIIPFVPDPEANNLLNDLENFPHAYVLACLMDRQITAEKAWAIPHKVFKLFGTDKLKELAEIPEKEFSHAFETQKFHRFNIEMGRIFYEGIQRIQHTYNGNAGNIWANKPSSATVVYRFLEFRGSGIKISTMAANILVRQFLIPFKDYFSIDISPDVHILRVMQRMGLVPLDANNDQVIYKARELNPAFPGIIDFSCWEIGKDFCRPQNPKCPECPLTEECEKVLN